jgi:hypothetical protein
LTRSGPAASAARVSENLVPMFKEMWSTHFTVDPNDWGFDNIFPAPPKAVEQVWFRSWVRSCNEELLDEKRQRYNNSVALKY